MPAATAVRRQVITDALAVLAVLPDPGTGLARLASRVLGDAHALDDGPVQAAVLRALSSLAERKAGTSGAARKRELMGERRSGSRHRLIDRSGARPHPARPGTGGHHAGSQRRGRHTCQAHTRPAAALPGRGASPGRPAAIRRVRLREPERRGNRGRDPRNGFRPADLRRRQAKRRSRPAAARDCSAPGPCSVTTETSTGQGSRSPGHSSAPAQSHGASARPTTAADSTTTAGKRLPPPASPVTTPWDLTLPGMMLDKMAVEEEAVIEDLLADLAHP